MPSFKELTMKHVSIRLKTYERVLKWLYRLSFEGIWLKPPKYQWKTKTPKYLGKARKLPLEKACEFCGSKKDLLRHHFDRFYEYLFITCCRSCHGFVERSQTESCLTT